MCGGVGGWGPNRPSPWQPLPPDTIVSPTRCHFSGGILTLHVHVCVCVLAKNLFQLSRCDVCFYCHVQPSEMDPFQFRCLQSQCKIFNFSKSDVCDITKGSGTSPQANVNLSLIAACGYNVLYFVKDPECLMLAGRCC